MERKIKVVLLCHYWSEEMAEMVGRKHYFRELSPWIQETLNGFKNKDDVELHVVAPNYASNTNVNCKKDGIYFHFYHYSPTWLSSISAPIIKRIVNHSETFKIAERLANTLTGFKTPAKCASASIRTINPDLIHLYGSENPDYASPAVDLIKDYPMLLTLQGYAYLQTPDKMYLERLFFEYRVKFESYINNTIKNFTTTRRWTVQEFQNSMPNHFSSCETLYYVTAITKIPRVDASLSFKEFDIVFYARIDKDKGIEDLIEVVANLKRIGRPLKTLIMGRGSENYISNLKELITEKDIDDIIDFAGFIEKHEDVYKFAAQAKVMVLPTHNDGIPNTIREAMFMKLPVVANNVGGIPRFNQSRHCIHMVEDGDLQGLADGICKVLDDGKYRNELITNAFHEAQDVYSPEAVYEQTIAAYKGIIAK